MKHRQSRHNPPTALTVGAVYLVTGYPVPVFTGIARHAADETPAPVLFHALALAR